MEIFPDLIVEWSYTCKILPRVFLVDCIEEFKDRRMDKHANYKLQIMNYKFIRGVFKGQLFEALPFGLRMLDHG